MKLTLSLALLAVSLTLSAAQTFQFPPSGSGTNVTQYNVYIAQPPTQPFALNMVLTSGLPTASTNLIQFTVSLQSNAPYLIYVTAANPQSPWWLESDASNTVTNKGKLLPVGTVQKVGN